MRFLVYWKLAGREVENQRSPDLSGAANYARNNE